jgi:hypothetical protein
LDGGEGAVHQWRNFGSGWQRRRHDEDQEEESWRCGNLHRGRVAFYMAEPRRGRAGVPSWPTLKEVFNAASYWRIEEGRGHHLMGEMKRRKCGDFFLQQRWPEAAMGRRMAVRWWRCLLYFGLGRKKEAGGAGWAKRPSGLAGCWADWAGS